MRIAGLAFPQGSSPAVQMFSLLDFSAVALGGGVDVRRSYYWVLGNLEGNTVYTVCTASTDERRHDSDAGGRAGGRRTPRTPWHVPEVCACMRICIYVPVRPCAMEKLDVRSCSLADGHATGHLHVLCTISPYRPSSAEAADALRYRVVVCSSLSESALQTNAGAQETETAHAYVAASGPNALPTRMRGYAC